MAIKYDLEDMVGPKVFDDHLPARRDPLDPTPLIADFAAYEPMITEMEAELSTFKVIDPETAARCTSMAGQARKLGNEIEKKRKEIIAPYKSVIDSIGDACKPFSTRLTKMRNDLEGRNRAWLIEEDRKRRAEEAKARAEAERLRKEAEAKARAEAEAKAKEMNVPVEEVPVAPVVAPVYYPPTETKISTADGSMKIEYEMVPEIPDIRALPDECFAARAKEILAAVMPWVNARKKAGIFNDPGIIWTKQPVTRTRAGR